METIFNLTIIHNFEGKMDHNIEGIVVVFIHVVIYVGLDDGAVFGQEPPMQIVRHTSGHQSTLS